MKAGISLWSNPVDMSSGQGDIESAEEEQTYNEGMGRRPRCSGGVGGGAIRVPFFAGFLPINTSAL